MKSPALAEVMKPLARLVAEAYEEYQKAILAYEMDVMVAEATKAALKDELKRAAKDAAKSGNRSKLDEIARRGQDTEVPEEPLLRRYKTEDATIEKISEILLENPRGILVHRDELSGWLRNLDKQGREGDRSFYLEAWNGTGSFDVDRIGRGSLHVPALCLSILGSIQPGPLSTYVYQATQGEKGDDGLLQRFQLLVWPDPSPSWRNVDRWPDTEAKNRAYEVFKRLDALDPEDFGASGEDEEGIPAVRFTDEAQEVFDRWRDELEVRLRTAELPPALESHLAKYRSLMPSLALIFQLIEFVDGTGEGGAVGLRPALQAAAWCEYLETHASKALLLRREPGDGGSASTVGAYPQRGRERWRLYPLRLPQALGQALHAGRGKQCLRRARRVRLAASRGGQDQRAVYHKTSPPPDIEGATVNFEMRNPAGCQKCQKGAERAFGTFGTSSS